jgi:hypothetical protein
LLRNKIRPLGGFFSDRSDKVIVVIKVDVPASPAAMDWIASSPVGFAAERRSNPIYWLVSVSEHIHFSLFIIHFSLFCFTSLCVLL